MNKSTVDTFDKFELRNCSHLYASKNKATCYLYKSINIAVDIEIFFIVHFHELSANRRDILT